MGLSMTRADGAESGYHVDWTRATAPPGSFLTHQLASYWGSKAQSAGEFVGPLRVARFPQVSYSIQTWLHFERPVWSGTEIFSGERTLGEFIGPEPPDLRPSK